MSSNLLKKNLALLEKKQPALAARLRALEPSRKYEVSTAKSGAATVTRIFPDGIRRSLHSSYDPIQEAARFIAKFKLDESANFLVGGVGLGYHLLELARKVSKHARILVMEKDPELLRLALEQNDFADVLRHPGATFHAAMNAAELESVLGSDKEGFALHGFVPVLFKPLVEAEPSYYGSINQALKKVLQEVRLDLKTQAAFSKLFFNNILANAQNILQSPGVSGFRERFAGVPAIVISAGPSLDKNIGLLKAARERALLISTATALQPLLKEETVPDFVAAIDPDPITAKFFGANPASGKTWLLYDPCIPKVVVDDYKHRRVALDSKVYLSQWIARHNGEKGFLGKTLSVAHTGFLFAKLLGCDPIILVGQDLAFRGNRTHCSNSFFNELLQDAIGSGQAMKDLERQDCVKYAQSTAAAPDIFGASAVTTVAMDSYKNLFAEKISVSKNVYNASEGGIPIPGALNLSLKEALFLRCPKKLDPRIRDSFKNATIKRNPERFCRVLKEKARRFKDIHRQLETFKRKYLDSIKEEEANRANFIDAMESFYKTLLKEEDTLQLLQGYAYSDFLQWNRESHQLALRSAAGGEDEESRRARFERDRKFLEAVMKTAAVLGKAFQETADRAKTETDKKA